MTDSHTKVKKAVFPVAGLGTRFLPATKAVAKEMLPIVDKPLIQYATEEAVCAGIEELIFVTSSSKHSIEDHYDINYELETKLEKQQKTELLELTRSIIPKGVTCLFVRQHEALGLGHAVYCARPIVGNNPFAVILADDLIGGASTPCMAQMVQQYENNHCSVIGVEEVAKEEIHNYGVIKPSELSKQLYRVEGIVEKPALADAPSNMAVVGRYILTPRIFELLEKTPRGAGNEIQLTDAIAMLVKEQQVLGYQFNGIRYDCGSKLGYLKATVEYALEHDELGDDFGVYLQDQIRQRMPKLVG